MRYVSGDIFASNVEALVNPVNTRGAMGAGLAKQFAQRYPAILEPYKKVCAEGRLKPGGAHVLRLNRSTGALDPAGNLWIFNLATKDHWRDPSRLEWVDYSMSRLGTALERYGIRSIAIPKLGSGLGGLEWAEVRDLMEKHLRPFAERGIDFLVYGEGPEHVNTRGLANEGEGAQPTFEAGAQDTHLFTNQQQQLVKTPSRRNQRCDPFARKM